MTRGRRPCVPASGDSGACVAALLHGAACCTDRSCASCVADRHWLVRSGYSVQRVLRAEFLARSLPRPRACPVCRCPAPAALVGAPLIPTLDRSHRQQTATHCCATCGRPLGPSKRRFCGHECRLQLRRRTEGFGLGLAPPGTRVHRVR